MSLFQNKILKKYIATESEKVQTAYQAYSAYFYDVAVQENIKNSKEEQFQEGFLRELFVKVLGYTLNPMPNYNLITEQKNETNSRKADGAILVDGEVVGIIELKDTKTTDLKTVEAQAFGYKNYNKKASYVVISNFEKLRFYIDNAVEFEEFNLFSLSKERFTILWLCLAYENIAKDLPKRIKGESLSSEDQITKELYKDYSHFKRELFADLAERNPQFDKLLLFKKSQKLLDRLLFIFFAEDRNLLPPNSMVEIIRQWEKLKELDEYRPLYDRFMKYFGYMNTGFKGKKHEIFAYNGGLFKPDEVLDTITISDDVLHDNSLRLSRYDFESEVDVNILGHIFENSLTEIEEISQSITKGEITPQNSKRKKDGVFYTPRYITTYIVENTVGKLCAEKKAELAIYESEYVTDKKRQKATKIKLAEKLETYRTWLLSITICDPACGSGAFLNAALDFLINEHALIDELTAKLHGASLVFPDIENAILENNLYGVDINEESVEIAKLSLWLRTAKPHRKLNVLSNNIKCGNSLISDPDVAGEKAFDWHKEFPQVFEKGGFDVVIGNPPYVLCQPSNTEEIILNYYKTYEVASYKVDLFHLFFEKGIKILNSNGKLGFITPNTYLMNKYIKPLRDFILKNTDIYSLAIHEESVFSDASVDVATIVLDKRKRDGNKILLQTNRDADFFETGKKNQSEWYGDADYIFNIKKSFEISFESCVLLGGICNSYFGIQAFDRKSSISETKENDNYLEIIDGGDVNPYAYAVPTKFFNYIESNIKSGGDWNVYVQDRIVIRQIGQIPIVGMSKKNILASNTLYSIYPKNDEYNLRYILCVLNSSLIKKYWLSKYSDSKQLFPKIKGYQLKELPIKQIPLSAQQPFIEKADLMLSLNSELQTKQQRFLNRLKENFDGVKITGALTKFDESDFKTFVSELKKQKIALSLKQQDEWEEYFNDYKSECNQLSAQITETDKSIDTMVYELYGLTEEEIEIVEKQ